MLSLLLLSKPNYCRMYWMGWINIIMSNNSKEKNECSFSIPSLPCRAAHEHIWSLSFHLRLAVSSFHRIINLAVAMIAYVMLSPERKPRLTSALWRIVINARIRLLQMRGKRCLITEKHGWLRLSLPSPFYCNHQEHVDALLFLLTSKRTRSNALYVSYLTRFFCFLWFEGYARDVMMRDGRKNRSTCMAYRPNWL